VTDAAADPLTRFRLDGRVVLLTGASSGIGEHLAHVLHAAGSNLVLAARRADRLEALAAELDGSVPVVCDVSRDEDLERLVGVALDRHGRVDVLVNKPSEMFREVLAVNLTAAFVLTQLVGRHMLERGSGVVVNVASVLGLVASGQIPQAGYVASKGGLANLTRELAAQWARRGVRVNALAPAWFHTEMTDVMFADEGGRRWIRRNTPMGRPGELHELDGALLFLASDASTYVTGQVLAIDGGWTAV
jgi:NAD(P)-dependent dehydrogenase (short-subunit alcohol dehydrogenase family)